MEAQNERDVPCTEECPGRGVKLRHLRDTSIVLLISGILIIAFALSWLATLITLSYVAVFVLGWVSRLYFMRWYFDRMIRNMLKTTREKDAEESSG